MLTVAARLLGDAERGSVERLLDEDPYGGAQVAERVAMAGLAWWRQDARVFGYGHRGRATMHPHRTTMEQQRLARPQRVYQMLRALRSKAEEIDDRIRLERGDARTESS